MGELESMKSKGGCSTLRNWMGELSDQDEEETTLKLSLGLPGGGWRTACKEKGKQSAVDNSMLSLGYSTVVSHSQGKAKGSPEAHPPATGDALAPNNNSSQTRGRCLHLLHWSSFMAKPSRIQGPVCLFASACHAWRWSSSYLRGMQLFLALCCTVLYFVPTDQCLVASLFTCLSPHHLPITILCSPEAKL